LLFFTIFRVVGFFGYSSVQPKVLRLVLGQFSPHFATRYFPMDTRVFYDLHRILWKDGKHPHGSMTRGRARRRRYSSLATTTSRCSESPAPSGAQQGISQRRSTTTLPAPPPSLGPGNRHPWVAKVDPVGQDHGCGRISQARHPGGSGVSDALRALASSKSEMRTSRVCSNGCFWEQPGDAPEEDELIPMRGERSASGRAGPSIHAVRRCQECGTIWNRDVNAARNIARMFWYLREHAGEMPPWSRRRPQQQQ